MDGVSSRKYQAFVFLLFLHIAHFFSSAAAAGEANTIVLGPERQDVYAPRDSVWKFNCTGLHAGLDSAWFIELEPASPSGATLLFGGGFERELNLRNISKTVTTHSERNNATSVVTVVALEDNNGIRLKCQTRDSMMTKIFTYTATLFVYGEPMPPKDVNVSTVDVQSVNISWSATLEHPEDVGVNFTLIVENLNSSTSNKQTMVAKDTYFVYNASSSASPCDVYMFYVTATNDAGTSDPSEPVVMMLPSLPNIKPVNDTLTHNISKIENKISVNIAFDAASSCQEYPVTLYQVLVTTSPNESPDTIATGKATDFSDNRIELQLSEAVQENTLYLLHIVATNEVGNVSSVSKECYTSDINRVSAEEGENSMFTVECVFISGSDALGCQVVFVDDFKNKTVMILRDDINSTTATLTLNMEEDGVSCYHAMYGFDIESDSNISSLAVPGHLSMTCASPLPPSSQTPLSPAPNAPFSETTIIILCAVVAGVLFILVLLLVVLTVVCCFKLSKRKASWNIKDSEKCHGGPTRNTYNVMSIGSSMSSPSSNSSPPHLASPTSSLSPDFHRQETQETCIDSSSSLNEPQVSDSPDSDDVNKHACNGSNSASTMDQLPDSHEPSPPCHSQSSRSDSQDNSGHSNGIESAVDLPDTQAPPLYAELTEFTGTRSNRQHSQTPPPIRRSVSIRASIPSPFHQDAPPSTSDEDPSASAQVVYDMPDNVKPRRDATYSLLDHRMSQQWSGERGSSSTESPEAVYSELADVSDSGDSRGQSPSMAHRNSQLARGSSHPAHHVVNEMYSQLNQTPVYAVLENSSSPEPPPLPPPFNSSLITPLTTPHPTPEHDLNDPPPPLYCEIHEWPTSPPAITDEYGFTDALNNGIPGAGTDVL